MKLTGYSLPASSTPIYLNILKKHSIFSSNIFQRNPTKSRGPSTYTQRDQVLADDVMVAGQYLPPWFRCGFIRFYFICSILFRVLIVEVNMILVYYRQCCSNDGLDR